MPGLPQLIDMLTVFFFFTANVQWNILGSFGSIDQFVIALNTDQAGLCAFTIPRYVCVECLQYACNIWLTRFRFWSFIMSFFYSEPTHSTKSVNTIYVKIPWIEDIMLNKIASLSAKKSHFLWDRTTQSKTASSHLSLIKMPRRVIRPAGSAFSFISPFTRGAYLSSSLIGS